MAGLETVFQEIHGEGCYLQEMLHGLKSSGMNSAQLLGFPKLGVPTTMENHMEKKMTWKLGYIGDSRGWGFPKLGVPF